MKKFAVVVIALFIFAFILLTDTASFHDVKQYKSEIDYLRNRGVITGYADGTFRPHAPVTRLQAVTMILRSKGITDFAAPDPLLTDMRPGFTGYPEVAKAMELGFIAGKVNADGTKYFDPGATLTRGQFAKLIVESYNLPLDTTYRFYDVPQYVEASSYVSTLAAARITTGYRIDGTFKPNNEMSRQHFAVFMARLLNDKFKSKVPLKNPSYARDPMMMYFYVDGDDKERAVLMRTGKTSGMAEIWRYSHGDSRFDFGQYEDVKGVYSIVKDGVRVLDLKYPVKIGQSWRDPINGRSRITAVGETVTTPAGTFENVVVVEDGHGCVYYYAEHVGLVREVPADGRVFELDEFIWN